MEGTQITSIMKVPNSQANLPKEQRKATRRFVYGITKATPAELAAFKKAQGQYYEESTDGKKTPLWYSNKFVGKTAVLGISKAGNVFADNTEIANLESLKEQYPSLAATIDKQIAGILFAQAKVSPIAQAVPVAKVADAPVDQE
jgi:hypothetical protein